MKKWVWRTINSKTGIIIDSRIDDSVPPEKYSWNGTKLWLKTNEDHKWCPLLVMMFSERFTWEEFEHYANVIVDRLNAMEVEEKLKGGS